MHKNMLAVMDTDTKISREYDIGGHFRGYAINASAQWANEMLSQHVSYNELYKPQNCKGDQWLTFCQVCWKNQSKVECQDGYIKPH